MRLDATGALSSPGEEFPFECSERVQSAVWNGEEVRFLTPVRVSGYCVAVGEDVWVRAEVSARMKLLCANCLGDAYHDGRASMDVCFSRKPDPEDPDLFLFEGCTLRLDDAAMGVLWMEMPMRVLCSPSCWGLCPRCGTDRNRSACSCQKELPFMHPFSALASLLNQDEEV